MARTNKQTMESLTGPAVVAELRRDGLRVGQRVHDLRLAALLEVAAQR